MLHSVEGDIYCLRVALGGKATTIQDVEEVWEVVVQEGQAVLQEWYDQKTTLE
jgi:aromatic-L-amino-acid decarboxylase